MSQTRKRAPAGAAISTARPSMRPAPGRLAAALHGFTAVESDPFVLGLFRMAMGGYVLLFYVMLAPSWLFYYGADGISPLPRAEWSEYMPPMRWPGLDIFAWGNAALSRVLTTFSLAVELIVPALVWFRRFRVPCVLAAMCLHAGMGVLIEGVMMFNGAMCVAMILFLPSRRTRTWLARRLDARPATPVAVR